MVETAEAAPDPAAAPSPRRTAGDWARLFARGLGQLLLTAGFVVLLFIVYEVYITNWFSDRAQAHVKSELRTEFVQGKNPLPSGRLALPGGTGPSVPDGTGIAILYIPRLGQDYSWAIVQGTNAADLATGPGHYDKSALPGQVGNFAVAGHRVGHGEPFLNLDHLRFNDAVIVQTESKWFVYRVLGDTGNIDAPDPAVDNLPGREVVDPGDGAVVAPVPDHPGQVPSLRLMTMTTCTPKFSSSHRMAVHGKLVASYPASGLRMPAQVKALYRTGGS